MNTGASASDVALPDAEWFSAALGPERPTTPVVVSVPHAGLETGEFALALAPNLDVRCDADLLVDQLYAGLPSGPFIVARYSRFVCDLNRHADDVSPATVAGHPAPLALNRRGFIWEITTAGNPAQRRPLPVTEWRARARGHAAYYAAIAGALARARAQFGFAILLDGHSMPSVGRPEHDDPGDDRADIVPGDRDGTSCAPEITALVTATCAARGFRVAPNEPYKGGFITAHHGRPGDNLHAIQIEIRRDLYMNESTFEPKPEGFARVRAALAEVVHRLDAFRI